MTAQQGNPADVFQPPLILALGDNKITLNSITALTEQLEKLISEHSLVAILRDHVALLRDQAVIFEKKAALRESEGTVNSFV